MRLLYAITFFAAWCGVAYASDDRDWFSRMAACVAPPASDEQIQACLLDEVEVCLEADGYTFNAPCVVELGERLRDASNLAFKRYLTAQAASDRGSSEFAEIGRLRMEKERSLGDVECLFQQRMLLVGDVRVDRSLDPATNFAYAGCLLAYEFSALRELRRFIGEEYSDVF